MDTKAKASLLFADETYALVGAALEVRNFLGVGFLEAVYQEALSYECLLRNIPVKMQVELPIRYKDTVLTKRYLADLIAYEKIIVELKTVPELTSRETAQLINYLKASGYRLGLIFNFGHAKRFEWKRFVV
ncbi:MAG: GxxExxY protein [Opitutales bacterium]|jgi:GxxExxY protein